MFEKGVNNLVFRRTRSQMSISAVFALAMGIVCAIAPANHAWAKMDTEPRFKVYNATNGHVDLDVLGFAANQQQGGQVAVGDLTGDGLGEIVLGSGSGRAPQIKVFTGGGRDTGWSVTPFDANYLGGVDVAVGDVDGDGKGEIIAAQHLTGTALVRVYKYNSSAKSTMLPLASFSAFGAGFSGGVNVAAGDVMGDARAEIVVGTELSNAARVRVFSITPGSGKATLLNQEFYPSGTGFSGGVDVAVGDVVAGGKQEIVTVPNTGAAARVKIYSFATGANAQQLGDDSPIIATQAELTRAHAAFMKSTPDDQLQIRSRDTAPTTTEPSTSSTPAPDLAATAGLARERLISEFTGFGAGYVAGANIAVANIDKTIDAEIILGKNGLRSPSIAVYSRDGKQKSISPAPYDSVFEGGVQVAAGDLDGGVAKEIVTFPSRRAGVAGRADWGTQTYVEVNLTEQRHYVYVNGILANTALISSGKTGPTYPGEFTITQRTYNKTYSGPGYHLPNTLWNMRYDGPRFLHGAYWHSNWGHPMSHGCVNMNYPDAEWLWNNSQLGTRVWIHW